MSLRLHQALAFLNQRLVSEHLVKYDFYFVAISSASCGAMESDRAAAPVTVQTIQDLTPFEVTPEKNLSTAATDAFEGQQITLPSTTTTTQVDSGGGGGSSSSNSSGTMIITTPLKFTEKLIVLVGNSSNTTVVVCQGGRMTDYSGAHPTEIRGMQIQNGRAIANFGGNRRRLGAGREENYNLNSDMIDGGALYLKELQSPLTIQDVIFRGNEALEGKG